MGVSTGDSGATGTACDFRTFLLGLASNALLHLGAMPDPDTNKPDANLPLARQTIDILAMLREKTAGNLSADEDQLFENLLYDLRLRFVQASRGTQDA